MDDDGFSALYREGHWFYQKYHNKVQAEESIAPYGFDIRVHERKKSHTVWQIHAIKTEEIPIETLKWAIDFEFNLPIGKTRKLNRHNDVKSILEVLYG
jgi:ParB family chromosome partitioning protein